MIVGNDWRREVLTVKEAADMLHFSTPTIYRMIRDGILSPAPGRLGTGKGVTVIPRAEVEHYIRSLRVASRQGIEKANGSGPGTEAEND